MSEFKLKVLFKTGEVKSESFGRNYNKALKVAQTFFSDGAVFIDLVIIKSDETVEVRPIRPYKSN